MRSNERVRRGRPIGPLNAAGDDPHAKGRRAAAPLRGEEAGAQRRERDGGYEGGFRWAPPTLSDGLQIAPLLRPAPNPGHADKPAPVSHQKSRPEADIPCGKIGGVHGPAQENEAQRD